jgi:hypothetical protein
MRPGRVVVINLERRTDRWDAFQRRWARVGGRMPVTRVPGVDMPADPRAGCWQAHINALRSGGGPVLVLEDDAVFAPSFSLDVAEPPPGWTMLRLGGLVQRGWPITDRWTQVERAVHTHAYIAHDPAALADRVAASGVRDAAIALTAGIFGQYRLRPGTVGQAAGHSDISGLDRPADEYWA